MVREKDIFPGFPSISVTAEGNTAILALLMLQSRWSGNKQDVIRNGRDVGWNEMWNGIGHGMEWDMEWNRI